MKTMITRLLPLALALPLAAAASGPGEHVYAFDLSTHPDGTVAQLLPRGGIASDALAAQVAAQVRQWRFEPAQAGEATSASTYLRVVARAQGEGVRIVDAATGPRPLALDMPAYTVADQRRGHEGVVVLRLDVDGQGQVTAAAVDSVRGSVTRRMGEAALQAAHTWRFQPERLAGQAQGAQLLLPVCFATTPGDAVCQWRDGQAQLRGPREVVSLKPVLRAVDGGGLIAGR